MGIVTLSSCIESGLDVRMMPVARIFLIALLLLVPAMPVQVSHASVTAGALPSPEGPVVLSISGAIGRTNVGDRADFDRSMLTAFPRHELVTYTPWTEGPQTFSGPALSDVLAAVEVAGTVMRAIALNDYEIDIPVSDAEKHDVLLALYHDGEPMGIRDMGPIWIIYPLDEEAAAASVPLSQRMVWQLRSLMVR